MTRVRWPGGTRIPRAPGPARRASTRRNAAIVCLKLEYRNPKSERNIKSEQRKSQTTKFGVFRFGFEICFGFRYSDFGFVTGVLFPAASPRDRRGARGRLAA